ncbi:MAG TPA: L,D-transpeptidase [Bauldia sp.]|nr:L,D-transpeptidase [Bauldia sp.]
MRSVLAALALLGAATLAPSFASAAFKVARPPAVLSPDTGGDWLLQMGPGQRAVFADPTPRGAYIGKPPAAPKKAAAKARRKPLDTRFLPQVVVFTGKQAPGTIVIDTDHRFLYLVLEGGKARRYGVGVGRDGFGWKGSETIGRKAEWPTWTPPPEMLERQPYLPASMKGGPGNPLGARALYLGDTLYRIHGTSEPWTIGQAVSSGCFRMRNEDVIDLYDRVPVGTKVVVL